MFVSKRASADLDIRGWRPERRQPSCSDLDNLRGVPGRQRLRLGAVALGAAVALLSLGAAAAHAAIAKVQAGTYLSQAASTSITPTLSSASTAGNLLVGVVATGANTPVTAPATAGTIDASFAGLENRAMGDLRPSAATCTLARTTPTVRAIAPTSAAPTIQSRRPAG